MLSNYITILFNRFSAVYEKQVFDKFQNPAAQVFGENKRANSSSQVKSKKKASMALEDAMKSDSSSDRNVDTHHT